MANTQEIEIWKKKLLDLGKRNGLVNYRDTKSSTLEILSPDYSEVFTRINTFSSVQIYDDRFNEEEEDEDDNQLLLFEDNSKEKISREEFFLRYGRRAPNTQLLVFNQHQKAKRILKNLMRRANDSLNERGVNILYIAFGFVEWRESEESDVTYKAPVIMVPITITNEAVNEPFFVHHFDDPTVNATLQYMLENQYGISMPVFEDQDLDTYLSQIESLVSRLKWRVHRECRIATFSFNKLNMYLDMETNAAAISENPNVAALTQSETSEDIFVSSDELDEMSHSRDLFVKQHNVVDADFSQTEAIEYAMMGKSFVLQGPPGTGKSQTITNMIAELIYAGKKVLFVSEKMAALEVVYKNLEKAKLAEFCLELHSYKANKKDFINALFETLMTPRTIVDEEAKDNFDAMNEAVSRLNQYDTELYKLRSPIGMSLYQLIALANHFSGTKEIPFVIKNIEKQTRDDLEKDVALLRRYISYVPSIGYDYRSHPLYGLSVNDSSYAFKLSLGSLLEEAKDSNVALIKAFKRIESDYGVHLKKPDELDDFVSFVKICYENDLTDNRLFDVKLLNNLLSSIVTLKELFETIQSSTNSLSSKYKSDIFSEDFKAIYEDFTAFGNSWFKRLLNSRYKASSAKLLSHRIGKKPQYAEMLDDLKMLTRRKTALEQFENESKLLKDTGMSGFIGLDTEWDRLIKVLSALRDDLKKNQHFSKAKLDNYDAEFLSSCPGLLSKSNALNDSIDPYFDKAVINLSAMSPQEREIAFDRIIKHLPAIDTWADFYSLVLELKQRDILPFVDMVLTQNHPIKDLESYYRLCFYREWIDHILQQNPSIGNYSRYLHQEDTQSFAQEDKKQLDISKALIKAKLSSTRPDPMLQMNGSPASVIMREHEKKRKLKPIRSLMREIPEFIQSLKPCFLMSPLSVSTFLSDDMHFDVTIFDEASQVFPEDAIVAIYRSKQLIVVGDSKQMPPTKFFMASDVEDEDYDEEASDIDSYESILDLCTTTFPTKSLLCHYRSRDESLISFSNKNFYRYNLLTYPSIHEKQEDLGVDFVYLPRGVMDSRTRVNILEAEKVVDLVFEHFRKHPNRSLGVVAFNIRQQEAILKLLDKRRANDPSLEEFFKTDAEEPFFVKNLETVQGDERDTIIFSVTYAKNDKGQFALRFGPLNLVGGERRLNVAITRAKLNVKVVASIRAFDIDIARVSNQGPKLLHDYLDYAEHGISALDRAINVNENEQFDSPFEQDVYEFLKEQGFDVTTQVGCSRYRIDLGLKRPGTSDYVLAIECDGATYHSSRSARDRDRLRQAILERMDWKFYRIWSTDWYKNNAAEKKALVRACQEALSSIASTFRESNSKKADTGVDSLVSTMPIFGSVKLFDDYRKLSIFCSQAENYGLNDLVEKYVTVEGPISIEYLLKQICWYFGNQRVTDKVRSKFSYEFRSSTIKKSDGFLYFPGQEYLAMREDAGAYLVDINYLSDWELRNGMYAAIEQNSSCKKEDLFAFIRNHLGFSRAGDKIVKKLENALTLLRPHIRIDDDGNIQINKSNPLKITHR